MSILSQGLQQRREKVDKTSLSYIFEEEPVDLTTFIKDSKYLNLPEIDLSPPQFQVIQAAERVLYADIYPKMGEEFGSDYWSADVPVKNLFTIMFGKGGGKDAVARFTSLRIAHILLCMRNPQEYFKMPTMDSIHLLNVASNAPQAYRAFFKPMSDAVNKGWFRDKSHPTKGSIQYAKNIEAISGHSDAEGQEGLNILLGVADEIDAFPVRNHGKNADGERETSTSAQTIMDMIRSSASAQPLDAKVLTPTGWKNMGDIQIGDRVVDPKGDNTSIVTGIFPQGITPVYEFEFFSGGAKTRASHHHLWQVEYLTSPTTVAGRKAGGRSGIVEKTVTTEWLVENLPKFQKNRKPLKVVQSNLHEQDFVNSYEAYIDPYLLGALIGDGGLTHYTATFTSAEQEMFDNVREVLPKGIQFSDFISHSGCRSVRLVNGKGKKSPLTFELEKLGLWGKHSYSKFIPEEYKWRSAEDRISLLQGLLDTDGCVTSSGAELSTTSLQLANDVADLARSLGLGASVYGGKLAKRSDWRDPDGREIISRRISWKVGISRNSPVDLFRLSRKLDSQPEVKDRQLARSIKSITRIEDDVTQCIKVSAKSELYITDDFIVTHNTRFPQTYKRIAISYPRYLGSPIMKEMELAKQSIKNEGAKSIYFSSGPYATWEVNPRVSGPEHFAEHYKEDPNKAKAMYECKPQKASDPYFRNFEIFRAAINRESQPVTVDYQLETIHSKMVENSTSQAWVPKYSFAPDFQPVQGAMYALHADLALVGDRAGIAMSHVEKWQEVVVKVAGEDGEVFTQTKYLPEIKVDFVIPLEADLLATPAREIQIRWARELAGILIDKGFLVKRFTFDNFQSADSMQLLEMQGIETDRVSADRTDAVWKNLRDVASEGRLKMPYDELLMDELESLTKIKGKVDHLPHKSKDLADALACSIVGAIAIGGEEDADGKMVDLGEKFFDVGQAETPLYGYDDFELSPIGMNQEEHYGYF